MFAEEYFEVPSRETVDKQAFSIVNKAIHFGVNSGLFFSLSLPLLGFKSLQLTRTSSTFCNKAAAEDSSPFPSLKMETSLLRATSLLPRVVTLFFAARTVAGFNSFNKNRIELGESKEKSSCP